MQEANNKNKIRNYVIVLAVAIVAIISILTFSLMNNGKIQNSSTTQTSSIIQSSTIQNSNITQGSNIIVPGPFPSTNCPAHFYQSYSNVTNFSGFDRYNLSGVMDYVIKPGNSGTITYTVYIGSNLNNPNDSTKTNITNWVQISHTVESNMTSNTHNGLNASLTTKRRNIFI